MTRDEAEEVMSHIWGGNPQHGLAKSYVDAFVALGMLKLDEPKYAEDFFIEELIARGFSKRDLNVVREALNVRRFKIVEK